MTPPNTAECREAPPRLPTSAEGLHIVETEATCSVSVVAAVLKTSERLVRESIASGDIAAIRLGRNYRVLCAPLRRQLGMET